MLNILQQHQSEFADALTGKQGADGVFINRIVPSSKISAQLALDIYKNNTRGARTSSLEVIYPICKKILGEEIFHSICKEYVNADINGASDLNQYGKTFSHHLKQLVKTNRLPTDYRYISELALLEYMIHAAYYADNDTTFDFALFEKKITENVAVYFKVSHSLKLFKSEQPIYEIWLNNLNDRQVQNVSAINGSQYLLVHREKFKAAVHLINTDEYQLIDAFINGYSLQDVIEKFEFSVDKILPTLITKKWLCGIK